MSKKPKDLYVILQCESSDKWIGIYEALYQNYLRQPCEKWLSFKIGKLEFPSEDIINNTKGWIITGSAAATYDKTLQWMQPLFNLIQKIYFEKKGKILGFCFGHQAIAKALGGDTEKMNLSIEKPYLLHKNLVKFNQNINTKKFYTKNKFFDYNQGVFLNQSHGDHVYLVPKNGEILAFSEDTKIEMFSIEENVLGIQSHPEFCDVMMKFRLTFGHFEKPEKWMEFVKNSFLNKQLDNHQVMNMCIDFLKN